MMMERLTHDKLKQYALGLIGHSSIRVEINNDDWEIILPYVLGTYNRYRPAMILHPLVLVPGKQEYYLHPDIVGRGVFDVVPTRKIGDNYFAMFDSSYFPLNYGGYRMDAPNFLNWRVYNQGQREVYGITEDFHYNPDTNRLMIYPPPVSSSTSVMSTMHNRRFGFFDLAPINQISTTQHVLRFLDSDGFPLKNLLPGMLLNIEGVKYRDDKNGKLTSADGNQISVDYKAGEFRLTTNESKVFETSKQEICEIRVSDYQWYKDFTHQLVKIIAGYKRRRFQSIPGQQASVNLDVEIASEGNTEIKELMKTAAMWLAEYTIPRQQ